MKGIFRELEPLYFGGLPKSRNEKKISGNVNEMGQEAELNYEPC